MVCIQPFSTQFQKYDVFHLEYLCNTHSGIEKSSGIQPAKCKSMMNVHAGDNTVINFIDCTSKSACLTQTSAIQKQSWPQWPQSHGEIQMSS